MSQKEDLFNEKLKEIFIGEDIEGESGFANLMSMKSQYFDEVFRELNEEIDEGVSQFPDSADFRTELYDKLYTFLKKYFSDSGGIYFTYTPLDEKIYERVYDNNQDVQLFWKTHMLYYVKTGTIWESLTIEDKNVEDGTYDFHFDVSEMEGKKANEKKDIEFTLEEVDNSENVVHLSVSYDTYGMSANKIDKLRRKLKKDADFQISNDELRDIFSTFRKQNEVDFFINKDPEGFLKEQFDLWMKEYLIDEETMFNEERLRKLKFIRNIAYKIIDFVSQFEEELKRIWNKPKLARDANYVLTVDRIEDQEGGISVLEQLTESEGWEDQVQEWAEMDLIENSDPDNIQLLTGTLDGKGIKKEYEHLPIDTKQFPEVERNILELFDNLDDAIDGRLIRSENYQALNTLSDRYRGRVDSVYIDPPFNKDEEADYDYRVKYKDATWITFLENRISLAKSLMSEEASIFVRCHYKGNQYVDQLLGHIFGRNNMRNECIVKRGAIKSGLYGQSHQKGLSSLGVMYDTLYWYTKRPDISFDYTYKKMDEPREPYWHSFKKWTGGNDTIDSMNYEVFDIDTGDNFGWMWKKERGKKAAENYREYLEAKEETGESLEEYWRRTGEEKEFVRPNDGNPQYWVEPKEYEILDNMWTDIEGYSNMWGFNTENTESLLKRVIQITSDEGDTVMDFFLGSGTTVAAAHKLGREWIGVELGDQFYNVVLPRMKQVLHYESSGISEDEDVSESYGPDSAGGFFKYFELEQYEDVLKKSSYSSNEPFGFTDESATDEYVFMRDEILLEAAEIDDDDEEIEVDLTQIYSDVDVAESLANLLGKDIKTVSESQVTFEDETSYDYDDLSFNDVKSYIWW